MNLEIGRNSLREKQRQERLELLLQAAEQVFKEKGYRDTSMDEIAARVGIATATIYLHFASKEELMVAAILKRDLQKVAQDVAEICATEENPTTKLRQVFSYLISSDFFRRRVQLLYAIGDSPTAQKALVRHQSTMAENAAVFSQALLTLLEQGQKSGEFRSDIESKTMLKALIGIIRSQSVTDTLLNNYTVPNDDVLDIYWHGIVQSPGQDVKE